MSEPRGLSHWKKRYWKVQGHPLELRLALLYMDLLNCLARLLERIMAAKLNQFFKKERKKRGAPWSHVVNLRAGTETDKQVVDWRCASTSLHLLRATTNKTPCLFSHMFSAPTEGTKHWFRKGPIGRCGIEGEHFPWSYELTSLQQIPLLLFPRRGANKHRTFYELAATFKIYGKKINNKIAQKNFYGNKFTSVTQNLLRLRKKVHSVSKSISGEKDKAFWLGGVLWQKPPVEPHGALLLLRLLLFCHCKRPLIRWLWAEAVLHTSWCPSLLWPGCSAPIAAHRSSGERRGVTGDLLTSAVSSILICELNQVFINGSTIKK